MISSNENVGSYTGDPDYTVVGAGLSGVTFARRKAELGAKVLVVEERSHLAGNAYDYISEHSNLLVHKYGPHLFHTNSQLVYDFLSRFTKWRFYEHRVRARVSNSYTVPVPVNFESIRIFGELDAIHGRENLAEKQILALQAQFPQDTRYTLRQLKNLGEQFPVLNALWETVYNAIFKNYTLKMWGCPLQDLNPSIADRVPLIAGYDDRYFKDTYQCMPVHGYAPMVRSMLEHPNIKFVPNQYFRRSKTKCKIYYTGSIDEYFDFCYGTLPYRGITFKHEVLRESTASEWFNWGNASTLNDPGHPTITRTSSMSRIAGYVSPSRTDCRITETPNSTGRYYPMPTTEAQALYDKYALEAEKHPNIKFAGRLGSYQYLNMDQAVAQALKYAENF